MLLVLVSGLMLATAPGNSTAAEPPATPTEEKKICRKQIETGSLIKGKKICFTAKQWQRMADAARDDVERNASMGSRSGQ